MYQKIKDGLLLELLKDLSPGDAKFDYQKQQSIQLAERLQGVLPKEARILGGCLQNFTMAVTGDGLKLKQVMRPTESGRMMPSIIFCKRRYCPICAPRRSRKFLAIFLAQKERLLQQFPAISHKWFMGTVSIKNPLILNMGTSVTTMHKGFGAMSKKYIPCGKGKSGGNKEWLFLGTLRVLEITKGNVDDCCHPHFHFLGVIPIDQLPSWASNTYDASLWLAQQYKKYMKLDYLPQCELHEVLPRQRKDGSEMDPLTAALVEVCKYSVKMPDILSKDELDNMYGWGMDGRRVDIGKRHRERPFEFHDFTPQFMIQMKGRKFIFKAGALKDYFGEDNEEMDLLKLTEDETHSDVEEIWDFVWNERRIGERFEDWTINDKGDFEGIGASKSVYTGEFKRL